MIEDIVIANGDAFFICKQMHTLKYVKKLHSYEIAILNNIETVKYDDLIDYHPLDVYTINRHGFSRKYVRMRYDLSDCEN